MPKKWSRSETIPYNNLTKADKCDENQVMENNNTLPAM